MSVMSVFEFIELFMDFLALIFIKYGTEPKTNKARQVKVKPKDERNTKTGNKGSQIGYSRERRNYKNNMAAAAVVGVTAGTMKTRNKKGNPEPGINKNAHENESFRKNDDDNRDQRKSVTGAAIMAGAGAASSSHRGTSISNTNLSDNYNTTYSRYNQKKVDSVSQYGNDYSRMSNNDSTDSVSTARSISSVRPQIAGATVATGHGVTPSGRGKDNSPPPPYTEDWPEEEEYKFVHPLLKV